MVSEYFCTFGLETKQERNMQWLEIAAVVILVMIGIFIYRNKTNA